jgi:carboxyl-terminal processing protease
MRPRHVIAAAAGGFLSLAVAARAAAPPQRELDTVRDMLRPVKETLRTEYYDPSFTGIAFHAIFADAEQRLATARNVSEATAIIAQAVVNLGDSHTYFIPPARPAKVKYGWQLRTVGANVHVGAVQPGSDAEKQGIRPGERVLAVNGMPATRESLRLLRYLLLGLRPVPTVTVRLQSPDSTAREVQFASEIKIQPRTLSLVDGADWLRLTLESEDAESKLRSRFHELAAGVLLWKLAAFMDDDDVQEGLRKAADYPHVILDLRGNPGGRASTVLNAIGAFLNRKETIGQVKRRDKSEPLVAESHRSIKGKLYVLVDGDSASAAEIFARAMQLAQRAVLFGDRTAGFVNEGRQFVLNGGLSTTAILYGVVVTSGAVVMQDGRALEKAGVEPDVWLVPSSKDLFAGHDPVLASAAKLAGVPLTAQQAGDIARQVRQQIYD